MSPAPPKKSKFSNALEALRSETVVVADTGDVAAMEQYKPTDATTNPSLVLACLRYVFQSRNPVLEWSEEVKINMTKPSVPRPLY